jgi:hypothetical protein
MFNKKKPKLYEINLNAFSDFMVTFYFIVLRTISFLLEKIDHESVQNEKMKDDSDSNAKEKFSFYNFKNFIFYTQYPSFILISPYVPFKNFILCVS